MRDILIKILDELTTLAEALDDSDTRISEPVETNKSRRNKK